MASKYQLITEFAKRTGHEITDNHSNWADFLVSAAWNYKYSFREQLLIYAQKPDATACAPIETWNKFGRWVNRGAKGIALLDDNSAYKLRYVFDVSDTNSRFEIPLTAWTMKPEYETRVSESLSNSFGEIDTDKPFYSQLIAAARNAVEDNYSDYLSELLSVKGGSFIEELDEFNIDVEFKALLENSVAFMTLTRCGIDAGELFEFDDLKNIISFNTSETAAIIGSATSDISEMVLREIEGTVRSLQRAEKNTNRTFAKTAKTEYPESADKNETERGFDYGTADLHNAGRLPDTRPDSTRTAENREIRNAPQEVSEREPRRDLHGNADFGQAEQPLGADRPTGDRDDGALDKTVDTLFGRNRTAESAKPDEMGGLDEQHQSLGDGNGDERADLQLKLPSVAEQQNIIGEAEDEKTSAFVMSQADIDSVLTRGSGVSEGKYRIYELYIQKLSSAENIKFLKNEYGVGGGTHDYPDGTRGTEEHSAKGIAIVKTGSFTKPDLLLTWNKVEKRIGELITADRYLNTEEKEHYTVYRKQKHEPQKEYRFSLGDTVYLGIDAYEIIAFDAETVRLFDTRYPLFNKEMTRTEFDERLRENPINNRLFVEAGAPSSEVDSNRITDVTAETVEVSPNSVPLFPVGRIDFLDNDGKVAESVEYTDESHFLADIKEENSNGAPMSIVVYNDADGNHIPTDWAQELDPPQGFLFEERASKPIINAESEARADAMLEFAEQIAEESDVGRYERFSVIETDDGYAVWDDIREEIYVDNEGISEEFTSEWEANTYLEQVKKEAADKESAEWLYVERSKQSLAHVSDEPTARQDNSELVGKKLTIDNRKYVVESVGGLSGDVSLRDVTFENAVGFPINRVEKLERIKTLLAEEESNTPFPAWEKQKKTESAVLQPAVPDSKRHNVKITDDNLGVGGAKEKFRNNMAAINLLHELESDGRLATPDEQEILSKYVGFGGLADAFDESKSNWSDEFAELYTALSPEEYAAARESTLTAFYTPPVVIRAMFQALDNMGFKTGNILEPSCGTGNFFGMLPDSMQGSKLYGVELDSITGRIAQQLYQRSNIAVQGYESTGLPDSFFDLAIGNVPFGQFKVADKKYNKHGFLIHDYFFAKTLDKVRPGGVVAFVTSSGTMDKKNPAVRKYIAQRAELLGAIRLPNNTFTKNAGTEVTSDIIFLQKRDRLVDVEPDWVHLNIDENDIEMNQYFIDNSDMVLGDMVTESSQFGMQSTCRPYENADLPELLSGAIQNIHAEITEVDIDDLSSDGDDSIPADPYVRNFSFTVADGKIYYRENSRMNLVDVSVTAENRIKGMIELRDCVRTLIEYQTEDYSETVIVNQRDKLNKLYDSFTEKYGLINARANAAAFGEDSSYCLLSSLEILNEKGELESKADMFYKRTIKQHRTITSVDTASESLTVSLSEKAKVDMEFMRALTGKAENEIFEDLKGVIFLNPQHISENDGKEKYLPADEYLSGNVREKLLIARRSAELFPDDYSPNVSALEAVQPVDLTASEISVRIGATWVPPEIMQQFMFELFQTPRYAQWNIKLHYSAFTSEWNIEGKNYDRGNVKAYNTYGTSRVNGYKIYEETLNLKDVRIFDYIEDADGKRTAVLNKKETTLAQGKQELIKEAFKDWIWADPERREKLCTLYNEKFNAVRPREYDGSCIEFSGINPEITLREHQINAVAHILYGGNALLAHVVGAGKTYEMTAAAHESKRLGLCQKSLIVVPNHLTGQWAAEYLQLYPSANILVATKKDFETKNRKRFCGRIATGDYDAVIIGHSQFEKIPMSIERQQRILREQLDEVLEGISELKHNRGENFSVKQLEKTRKSIQLKLDKLNDQSRKDDVVTFEELGVDRLFIDESHFYKNLFLYTKMRNVGGIAQTEAQKSSDLFMKCRYLDEITGGRGVVFATGTPISNSMVEMYTLQRYLQYNNLKRNSLQHFDSWASTFGETVTAIELSPEGTGYRAKTRFAKFYNLPELMCMFKEVADIKTADMLELPVPEAIYHNVAVKPSVHQKEMVASLAERAERVRGGMVDSSVDNMLLITNDGRKLALDQRLINTLLPDDENGKTASCANNVFEIWVRTAAEKSAQLVFCDLSTPHIDGSFNVYEDLKKKLTAKGVPPEEIMFIHEANTEAQKEALFDKVRSGQVRVLVGSTFKMGAGTNVQKRLIALHHLDCPWRPSDLQQREGRIIRQGNENPQVEIFSYVTENTFDAYLYQLVENKQKFISQVMTSKSPVRSAEDVDEQALSYAEIKALATGNPHIKEKMDLDIDVSRLKLLKANHLSQRYSLEDRILKEFPQKIRSAETRIAGCKADMERLKTRTVPNEDGFCPMTVHGVSYTDKKEAGTALIAACKQMTSPEAAPLGEYRGFAMSIEFDSLSREYRVTLKNELSHTVAFGTDIFGNIQRIDNALEALPLKLQAGEEMLENAKAQLATAKLEVEKPFSHEEELQTKTARLNELNSLLSLDKKENELVDVDSEPENEEKPQTEKFREVER